MFQARGWSVAFIVLGALTFLLAVAADGFTFGYFSGPLCLLLGILLLVNPLVLISPTEVAQRNALGMTMKRTPIHGYGDLAIADNKLYRRGDGKKIFSLWPLAMADRQLLAQVCGPGPR